jgi:hypothetical protein
MGQKQKILIGLLALLAVAVAYRLMNPFEQASVDRLTYARATKVATTRAAGQAQPQAELRLDLFQSPPQINAKIERDLFQRPSEPISANDTKEKPAETKPPPRPKTDQQKIEEHFKRFKVFGSYRHGKKAYLFLQRGKQVLVVTQGDRIDGKYEIKEVAEKSATISAQNLPAPIKIHFDEL